MQLNFNRTNYSYNPAFSSCHRDVSDKTGKVLYRNNTSMFRSDIKNWDKFVDYLEKKFKDADRVNIYCLASSAGDEPYSLAIKLIERLGEEKAQKYFPIHASDCDKKIINLAKCGYLPIFDEDIDKIYCHTNGNIDKYFDIAYKRPKFIDDMDISYDTLMQVKPYLKDKVVFSVADATKKCKTIRPENTIVLARNFWPYLKNEETRIKFANDLFKNTGKNSIIVVGEFDDSTGSGAAKNLYDAGFYCNPEIYTIFEKNEVPHTAYFSYLL